MASVRTSRTAPEEVVASALRKEGVRFRRNVKRLIGSPDFLLPDLAIAVFVHGCFWHGHSACRKGRTESKTNQAFWKQKIAGNVSRDRRVNSRLRLAGYSVVTVWECELGAGALPARLVKKLAGARVGSP